MDKSLLILGSGSTLWDDIEKVDVDNYDVMAVNMAGLHYSGHIDHFVSFHSGYIIPLSALRKLYGYKKFGVTHSIFEGEGVDRTWPEFRSIGGTSSLIAVLIAKKLGYDNIVLAGIPMDRSGHFYDRHEDKFDSKLYMFDWNRAKNKGHLKGVTSLSGNTKVLLEGV